MEINKPGRNLSVNINLKMISKTVGFETSKDLKFKNVHNRVRFKYDRMAEKVI